VTDLTPSRVLVIVAHPDDVEYFCGGLIAGWIEAGATVAFVVVTSGDKGSDNATADITRLVETREQEQRASARVLGVEDVTFLRHPDSELSFVDYNQLRGELVRHIRRTQAEVVVTHDPFVRRVKQHFDHRVVGQLALDAAYPIASVAQCYSEQIIEEGLSPWQPSDILLFGTDQPNYAIDITATLDRKIAALQEHRSQEYIFTGGIIDRLRWKAKMIGQAHGLSAAEEFMRVRLGPSLPER
jgi:LmbE family N-acetylglucosaminyl deacetylase